MKNILLLVHDDSGQEARYQAALDLTRAVRGHLSCLDVTYAPAVMASGYYDDALAVAELVTQESEQEAANKAKLVARLGHEDVSWDWIDATGEPASALRNAADWADIIVVNRMLETPAVIDMRRTAGELIVRSGKPVFAIPPALERLDLSSVLIAWDGSRAAGAAVRAAIPLLLKADRVVLVEALDGSIDSPAEEAASYLSRHDVHATIKRVQSAPQGAGETLLGEARDGGFGYIVMGGFSHSRFVEALFGGVTRTMLKACPIPVLLAH
jgi:nucleotide-binding universal stress UspA family protein